MKLNKPNISKKYVFYIVLALSVFFTEYEFLDSKKHTLPPKSVLSFDETVFEQFGKKYDDSRDVGVYWGYAKIKEEVIVVAETQSLIKDTEVTQADGQNSLCISKSCYRLLGIHYEKRDASITLFNTELKEKVRSYKESSILQDGIEVKSITMHQVLFRDINSTREWSFEIFDVNETEYKPKELEL